MQKKRFLSLLIIALVLAVTIPIGYSVAWFTSQKSATGTITLKPGIIINYEGLQNNSGTYNLILGGNTTGTLSNTAPGEQIAVSQVRVWQENKASTSSVVLRFKLTYSYSEDGTSFTTVSADSSLLHLENNITVTNSFIKSGDYYYYVSNSANALTYNNLAELGNSSSKLAILDNLNLVLDDSVPAHYQIKIQIEFDGLQHNASAVSETWGIS